MKNFAAAVTIHWQWYILGRSCEPQVDFKSFLPTGIGSFNETLLLNEVAIFESAWLSTQMFQKTQFGRSDQTLASSE
jgi:hypothetical protein